MSPWWYRWRILVLFLLALIAQTLGLVFWHAIGGHLSIGQYIVASFGESGAKITLILSLLIGTAGVALRIWGSSYLHATTVWSPHATSQQLIVAGPFRFTRNPLYLGNVFFFLAFFPFATPPGAVLLLLVVMSFSLVLIHHEEAHLRSIFGGAFQTFTQHVPRLIPRLFPAPGITATPNLASGLRSEIFMLGLYVGLLGYLLGSPFALVIWAVSLASGIMLQRSYLARP